MNPIRPPRGVRMMRDLRKPDVVRHRAFTLPVKKITKKMLRDGAGEYPEGIARPRTRAECYNVPRPCPFVGCKYNLFLDVNPSTGSIKLNFPHIEPWEMAESCALDITDQVGPLVLEEVAVAINMTRERIRQIEEETLNKLREQRGLEEFIEVEA